MLPISVLLTCMAASTYTVISLMRLMTLPLSQTSSPEFWKTDAIGALGAGSGNKAWRWKLSRFSRNFAKTQRLIDRRVCIYAKGDWLILTFSQITSSIAQKAHDPFLLAPMMTTMMDMCYPSILIQRTKTVSHIDGGSAWMSAAIATSKPREQLLAGTSWRLYEESGLLCAPIANRITNQRQGPGNRYIAGWSYICSSCQAKIVIQLAWNTTGISYNRPSSSAVVTDTTVTAP